MVELIKVPLADIERVPTTNGIYMFRNDAEILYVGKSVNIRARVHSHIESAKISAKESGITGASTNIEYAVTDSEFNALLLESSLIQKYRPKYNVQWRDDKSYLYIKITTYDEYPKLFVVRKEREKGSAYFGPFSSTRIANQLVRELRRIIPFCQQKSVGKSPCFYAKIGLCNPCPNVIESSPDEIKPQLKKRYRRNISSILRILRGNIEPLLRDLHRELGNNIKKQEYEVAIGLRDRILRLQNLLHNQIIGSGESTREFNESEKALALLLDSVRTYFPRITELHRIECYDISNLLQKSATASMVVLIDGLTDRSEYRRFRIKNPQLHSDFSMLHDVLSRRFKQKWQLPDLLIVDGGRPQVKQVLKTLSSLHLSIPAIGIAKNPDRLVIGNQSLKTVRFIRYNRGFNLIQQLRDESHRFARKYHLLLRNKHFLPR